MQAFILRLLDIVFAFTGLVIFIPVLVVISIVGYFDTGSPFFSQRRVGKNKSTFVLIKFRTMHVDTKSVASHLASSSSITKTGKFLRKAKLDELPQLWNVLAGDMSLVGPRPCLSDQEELIKERDARNVFDVLPGITGLAQIQGVDMSTPQLLAKVDESMIRTLSFSKYFGYIFSTVLGKGSRDAVRY